MNESTSNGFFHESLLKCYSLDFPSCFESANGSFIKDEFGKTYIDFFSGAGALNYGHNNKVIRQRVINHLKSSSIIHSLDMHTIYRKEFIDVLYEIILKPRKLDDYKVTLPGPTGTNAVELALKYARKKTGRSDVIAFTGGFHGMTLGALALTANSKARSAAGVTLPNVIRMPFCNFLGEQFDSYFYLEKMIMHLGSGLDLPAAIILETIQIEGGLNVASIEWLQKIERLSNDLGIVLIVDDIQAGCGRTGTFFSFERAKIKPDIVILSKSIGGIGMPLSVVLLKKELDILKSGDHSGTFRGNNLAFVAGAEAIRFWADSNFINGMEESALYIQEQIEKLVTEFSSFKPTRKGLGMIQGIAWSDHRLATKIADESFNSGLIIEKSGAYGEVLKIMPPLNIDREQLKDGMQIIRNSIKKVIENFQ